MEKYLIDCTKDVIYFKYFHPFEILRDLKVDTWTLKWNIAICRDGTKVNIIAKNTQKDLVAFQQAQIEELPWIRLYVN